MDPDCKLPVLYDEKGYEIDVKLPQGCHFSDFNQFGDVEAFGVHPTWKRQLSKFAGVQDRVKDWHPRVQPRLVAFACLLIHSLDIDGFRIDKATQVTLEFLAKVWGPQVRECAASRGKDNFFIPGEITTKVNFGALYVGRGIQSHNKAGAKSDVLKRTNGTYMRESYGLDSSAFHYSMYRSMLSCLGVFGNINSDIAIDPVEAWNELYLGFDFVNAKTGNLDPR